MCSIEAIRTTDSGRRQSSVAPERSQCCAFGMHAAMQPELGITRTNLASTTTGPANARACPRRPAVRRERVAQKLAINRLNIDREYGVTMPPGKFGVSGVELDPRVVRHPAASLEFPASAPVLQADLDDAQRRRGQHFQELGVVPLVRRSLVHSGAVALRQIAVLGPCALAGSDQECRWLELETPSSRNSRVTGARIETQLQALARSGLLNRLGGTCLNMDTQATPMVWLPTYSDRKVRATSRVELPSAFGRHPS